MKSAENSLRRARRCGFFCAVSLVVLAAGMETSDAAPRKIVLPPETAGFSQSTGVETVMGSCLQCHSAEYVTTQPRLTRPAWKASLEKMRAKYGASISADQEAVLLEYLVANYGVDAAPGK